MYLLRVLIIEDSENDALLLIRALRKGGYEPVYQRVQTEEGVRAALEAESWDLVLSDHDMPSFSAPAALAVLKESGLDLPFIIVSGAIGEEIAVELMKAGAHDFIKKGKMGRLIPAIERELREAKNRRQQREAEEMLRKREQEFKALVENAPDIVARFDREWRYLYVNPAMEKDTGMPPHAFIGRTHEELNLHPNAIKQWNHAFTEAFATGSEATLYFDYFSPFGLKYYHTRVVPEYGSGGTVNTVLTITRDVTDLKAMENELQEELAKTRRLHLRSLPELPPALPGLTLGLNYRPARQLKGDSYNIIQKDNRIIFYMVDSSVNGLDGVMLSGFVQQALGKYLDGIEEVEENKGNLAPQKILQHLLQQYERDNRGESSKLSLLLAVFNTRSGKMHHVAHNFNCAPLLVSAGGEVRELETSALSPLQHYSNSFEPGQTLLCYTDGFISKNGIANKSAGLIKKKLLEQRVNPPEIILKAIGADPYSLPETNEIDEDITVIALQAIEKEHRLFLDVESSFSVIEGAKEKVYEFIMAHTPADTDLFDFHELLVNAIEHGNKQDGAKRVSIDVTVGKTYYRIAIEDEGEGFNWRDRIKRELDLDDFYERGRGIIMTRMMSDYLGYNERGNRVTVIKLI